MDNHKLYKSKGLPYTLASETFHDRQRYAVRDDDVDAVCRAQTSVRARWAGGGASDIPTNAPGDPGAAAACLARASYRESATGDREAGGVSGCIQVLVPREPLSLQRL
ncbi:hypothetical protein SETIT_2G295300v2 [Setaria italica]|uniref:Uncharacterized protein n=1 Tax=Setaria italica TaxID=4555 RepID=A0A368Q4E6_SETIT|nr:hypothetical protein SETIT_2G295300v2 [Setaria italica]